MQGILLQLSRFIQQQTAACSAHGTMKRCTSQKGSWLANLSGTADRGTAGRALRHKYERTCAEVAVHHTAGVQERQPLGNLQSRLQDGVQAGARLGRRRHSEETLIYSHLCTRTMSHQNMGTLVSDAQQIRCTDAMQRHALAASHRTRSIMRSRFRPPCKSCGQHGAQPTSSGPLSHSSVTSQGCCVAPNPDADPCCCS